MQTAAHDLAMAARSAGQPFFCAESTSWLIDDAQPLTRFRENGAELNEELPVNGEAG